MSKKDLSIQYNKQKMEMDFGRFGNLKFQRGSLNNHKRNGVLDTDILTGLITYLAAMNKKKPSQFNALAIGNLQSAFMFLKYRRIDQHIKDAKAKATKGSKNDK